MFLRHAAVIACGNEEDWLISRSIEDHGTYYLNLFVCNPWRLGLWAWTMSSWLIHILETGELLRLLDFFLRAGPFFASLDILLNRVDPWISGNLRAWE